MVILEILQGLFGPVWALFTDLNYPGLGVSFATVLIAFIIIRISISIFHRASGGGGSEYRSGSSRNPKISDNRKGDQF